MNPPDLITTTLDLRRAILGQLLAARAPVRVTDIVAVLVADFGPEAVTPKRVSDVLRYQVRPGRVRRVDRGLYEPVPVAIPRSTAWRCLNWRRAAAYAAERAERASATRAGLDAGPFRVSDDIDAPPASDVRAGIG